MLRGYRLVQCVITAAVVLVFCTHANASTVNLEIGVQDDSPIDIVLTGSSNVLDTKQAEANLRFQLERAGVDLSRVQFDVGSSVTISSQGSGAQEIVDNWKAFPKDKELGGGQTTINNGQMMIGPSGGGPGGMFDPTLMDAEGDVEINFTFQTTCVPYSPAVLLRWTQNPDGTYSGYVVGMSTTSHAHKLECMPMTMYIWKVTSSNFPPMYVNRGNTDIDLNPYAKSGWVAYKLTDYMTDGIMAPDAPVSDKKNDWNGCANRQYLYYAPKYNYHVTMKDGKIRFELYAERINGQTLKPKDRSETYVLEWEDPDPFEKGTVGFFSHNANAVGMPGALFQIDDVNDLLESVRSPNWRPNSHRFIIDAIDKPREDFESKEQVGELSQRINADGAHYIGWGTYGAKGTEQQQKWFIDRLTPIGTWYPVGSDTRFKDTAYWMEPIVNKRFTGSDDVTLVKDKEYKFDVNEK